MQELIKRFLSLIDIPKTNFRNLPSIVFLCGGPIPKGNRTAYSSARHYVYKHIKDTDKELFKRIILAENLATWHAGKHYKNLMDFERDIASIAAVIAIFIESPGSIAELGAFAMVPELSSRMIVFMQRKYHTDESFINDGILEYIKRDDKESVYVYHWEISRKGNLIGAKEFYTQANLIMDDISKSLSKVKLHKEFNKSDAGLQLLFLAQAVYLFGALKLKDCTQVMEHVFDIGKNKVVDLLYALKKMGLIDIDSNGSNRYYVPLLENNYCSFYSAEDGGMLNNDFHAADFRECISTFDERRYKIILENNAQLVGV